MKETKKEYIKCKYNGRLLLFELRMIGDTFMLAWIRFICFLPSKYFRRLLFNCFKGVEIAKGVSIYHGFQWRKGPFVVGNYSSIGAYNHFDCSNGIYIGKNVNLASNVCIQTVHNDSYNVDLHTVCGPVTIGDYAWVCSHTVIMPGVTIGEGALIANGAVVTSDVAPYTVVGGVPAIKNGERDKRAYDYMPSKYWIPFHGITLFPILGEVISNFPAPSKWVLYLKNVKHLYNKKNFFGIAGYLWFINMHFKKNEASGKMLWGLNEKLHHAMYEYVYENLSQYRHSDYEICRKKQELDDQNIWVCWLQGEDHMPDVVKACYKSLKNNSNGHNVILITNDNLNNYLEIPESIYHKVGKGMSFAHFSDYIRLNLLALYGGLWVDSTFFVTKPIDTEIFNTEFFSIKNDVHDNGIVCRYLWAVNFVYSKAKNEIMTHIRNMFCAFWENNNRPIDYLLMDYLFEYERLSNPHFNDILENMPYSNEDSHKIRENFNKIYREDQWKSWLSSTSLFKLTYKGDFIRVTPSGELTYYGKILLY